MNDDLDHKLSGLRGRVQTVWSASRAAQVLTAVEKRKLRRQLLRRRAAQGFIVGCLLIFTPLLFRRLAHETAPEPATAVALRLPDGSLATALSPDTELIHAESRPDQTVLRLLRGSARFQVQKNPRRVFRVEAGRTAVEVLGTQFTVARRAELTEVVVTEGRVRVLWDSHYAELAAGQRGTFPPPDPVPALSSQDAVTESAAEPRPERRPDDAIRTVPKGAAEARTPNPPPLLRPKNSPPVAPSESELTNRQAARWRVLAQEGQFEQAYRAVETNNLATASDEPGDLLLLADIARLSHHPAESVAPLEKLLREHRSDPRAALCAFTLGRVLLDDLGKPREAATAFREAQLLDPSFAMIEDALAREVKALWRAGDSTAAHERALAYLRQFPTGSSARSVRRFGAVD